MFRPGCHSIYYDGSITACVLACAAVLRLNSAQAMEQEQLCSQADFNQM